MTRPLTRGVAALRLPFALLARLLRGVLHRSALTGDAAAWPASLAFEGLSVPSASLAHAPSRPSGPIEPTAAEGQLSLVLEKSTGRKRRGTRRLAVAASYVASLAAVAALVGGATFGFFSATASSSSSSFSAGTVTLGNVAGGSCGIPATGVLPDGVAHSCTLSATYGGSVDAYLGLDILIETQAGPGGRYLYDPTDSAHDLQVTVSSTSPAVTYDIPATALANCPSGAPLNSVCYEADDLVSQTPFHLGDPAVDFTADLTIPTSSTTDYQGGSAQVYITAHAAQSSNNAAIGSCSGGQDCSGNWS